MQVPPHPHTGLQTVTWLLDGEVLHRDSLGSRAADPARPAQPDDRRPRHRPRRGVARRAPPRCTACSCGSRCPTRPRRRRARFEHHADLPALTEPTAPSSRCCSASLGGGRSPAPTSHPAVGAELAVRRRPRPRCRSTRLRVRRAGRAPARSTVDGVELTPRRAALPRARPRRLDARRRRGGAGCSCSAASRSRRSCVMWWNFVGRSHEEIVAARRRGWPSSTAASGRLVSAWCAAMTGRRCRAPGDAVHPSETRGAAEGRPCADPRQTVRSARPAHAVCHLCDLAPR